MLAGKFSKHPAKYYFLLFGVQVISIDLWGLQHNLTRKHRNFFTMIPCEHLDQVIVVIADCGTLLYFSLTCSYIFFILLTRWHFDF